MQANMVLQNPRKPFNKLAGRNYGICVALELENLCSMTRSSSNSTLESFKCILIHNLKLGQALYSVNITHPTYFIVFQLYHDWVITPMVKLGSFKIKMFKNPETADISKTAVGEHFGWKERTVSDYSENACRLFYVFSVWVPCFHVGGGVPIDS